jgi:hypothetical protein
MTREIKIAEPVWESIKEVSDLTGIRKQSLANVALQLYFSNEDNRLSLVNFIQRNNLKEKGAKDLEEMAW